MEREREREREEVEKREPERETGARERLGEGMVRRFSYRGLVFLVTHTHTEAGQEL